MITYCGHRRATRKHNKENKMEVIFPCRNQCQTLRIIYQNAENLFLCSNLAVKLLFQACAVKQAQFSLDAAGHAFKNLLYQTHVGKCENAVLKSRQNLSGLLSIVGNIFFNLLLLVHLRKKHRFEKEKQYSTQNSVFLDQFYRMSGSRNTLYDKCRDQEARRSIFFQKMMYFWCSKHDFHSSPWSVSLNSSQIFH